MQVTCTLVEVMSVKSLLESLEAPARAVAWAEPYGDDLRLAWSECEHPELLLPIACGIGVASWDVLNAAIEVIRENLACVVLHKEVIRGLDVAERFISFYADAEEMTGVLMAMSRLAREVDRDDVSMQGQRSSYGSVAHICEAIILAQNYQMKLLMSRLSTAVVLAAQARAQTLTVGSTSAHMMRVIEAGLRGTAPIVRLYIPFESVVGGVVAMTQKGEAYVPDA